MGKFEESVYQRAAKECGKTPEELKAMATSIFASMLHHSMNNPDKLIWTAMRINHLGLMDVEVNMSPRL